MDEEREEGELTDEELEDVSDSTISLGSLTNLICREPFKELSLTSVSDESSDNVSIIETAKSIPLCSRLPNNRKFCKRKRLVREYSPVKRLKHTKPKYSKAKYQKQYSSLSSSSSESEQYVPDEKVLRQLRDAVRISSAKKNPNCSLRTRIKRMIEPSSPSSKQTNSEDDPELESLRDQALKSKSANPPSSGIEASNITDDDLINLRLVALQSAVLKKHENRRKRKEEQESKKQQIEPTNNDLSLLEIDNVEKSEEVKTESEDIIKTEDKIVVSHDMCGESEVMYQENEVVSEQKYAASDEKLVVSEDKAVASAEMKMEIISQKSTPEEDEDILRAMLLTSISKKISNKIGPKLMECGKKVAVVPKKLPATKMHALAPVKPLVINVNSDSESDPNSKSVKKPDGKPVGPKGFEQDLSRFLKEARIKSELQQQSDISRHLPRSQQIEYRHLKRKLQQLSKLKSHKRFDDENKRVRLNTSKKSVSKMKVLTPLCGESRTVVVGKKVNSKADRLQGKYESLAPLMVKISQAKADRDKAQNQVKRLINELRNARIQLTSTHQNYTVLVQRLLHAKADLDQRTILTCSENQKTRQNAAPAICTSTPYKENAKENICEISNILSTNPPEIMQVEETGKEKVIDAKDLSTAVKDMDIEEGEKVNNVIEENVEIDKIPEEGLAKYSSPLDHIQDKSGQYVGNPLMVLCPYDLLGVCRDPDCTYRH